MKSQVNLYSTLTTATIFAIAMAALESIVVVYLRQLYYPNGFEFPLIRLSETAMGYEWLRETATLFMLVTAAMMVSPKKQLRFAWFLFLFAVWDIWYYIWLKVLLDWPESLFTWDILFLIPVPWLGPVLAPVLCSLSMILFSWIIFRHDARALQLKFSRVYKFLIGFGILLVLFTFMYDYGTLVIMHFDNEPAVMMLALSNYIPTTFNWPFFLAGLTLILYPLLNSLSNLNKPNTTSI